MLTRSALIRTGFVLLLAIVAVALAQYQPTPNSSTVYASQGELTTFVDRPSDAAETYPGSGIYKRASISPEIEAAVKAQSQEDWEKYHIAKESNLGLPLGSVFLQALNGKYVELALYERAAFTVFKGKPARQILSTIIFEGRVQVTEDEFISVPSYLRNSFVGLPIAGEGDQSTPSTGAVAKLLSTDKAKAVDGAWSKADQLFRWDGTFTPLDGSLKVESLTLGQPDATTGHKVPDVLGAGLSKLFGEKVVENAGLPLSPAVWILAQVQGKQTSVCVQVFQRAIVTYNPANDEANRVQVGLGGRIVQGGLGVSVGPTATPLPPTPTATPKPYEGTLTLEVQYKGGTLRFITQDGGARFTDKSKEGIAKLFDAVYDAKGYSGRLDVDVISLPVGRLDGLTDTSYSNGKKIYNTGTNTSTNKGFNWYDVDMAEEIVSNGVKKGTLYHSIEGKQANLNLLIQSQGTQDGDRIGSGVERTLLMRYSHSEGPSDFYPLISTRTDLYPLLGGNINGQLDYSQVPLKLLPPVLTP